MTTPKEDRAIKQLQNGIDWLEQIKGTEQRDTYNCQREKITACIAFAENVFQKKIVVKDGRVMWEQ